MTTRHGTYLGYVTDRCRQECCRTAWRDFQRQRARNIAYRGQVVRARVDPSAAQARIIELRAQGISSRTIGTAVNISERTIEETAAGKRHFIFEDTHNAIMGFRRPNIERLADRARIDATGTRRRIQALVALGWTFADLGERLGCSGSNVRAIVANAFVQVGTARAVADLYDQMWDQIAPKGYRRAVALRLAASRSWAPPLAWDDIDDPNERPNIGAARYDAHHIDETAVVRRCEGDHHVPLTNDERREVVRRLHSRGFGDNDIERISGIHSRQVLRDRRALSLPANIEGRRAS